MAKASLPQSPLAPKRLADLPPIEGARMAVTNSGTRYKGRPDLLLMSFAAGTVVAGLTTSSSMPGAPVEWCRRHLPKGKAAGLVVNAGNANVFTGRAGAEAVTAVAAAAARLLGCKSGEVMLASTGVIGQILPHVKIVEALTPLPGKLQADGWADAAEAIRTTDTFPKRATQSCAIAGQAVTINGIAKGSGMIAPDMATMLCFIATDAKLPPEILQVLLREANAESFNCLTVDGDTSTSDTVLLFATGQARHPKIDEVRDPRLKDFRDALFRLMADLAEQVARDGEGARKLVTVRVSGAATAKSARKIALTIANSPLVKTAIAGEDANWGRIVMAVGKSGEKADRDRLAIRIGGQLVTAKGMIHPDYDEARATAHLKESEIDIEVDVGVGRGRAKVWTCDLTHGYIDINADYRS
ncbi:MAG: bifunctional glutamate N-acetyltransferase/amino-acid acetyltransferase ArgJ [Alphaproteobacteria bacterium]|nr:bifunctional glutamate N-acetyltransferase/amino-acid acetyltransferase ArgJ [Alphaproteobacteria bacterium]